MKKKRDKEEGKEELDISEGGEGEEEEEGEVEKEKQLANGAAGHFFN